MYLIYGLSTTKCIMSYWVNLFILHFVFFIRPLYCKHYNGGIDRFSDSSSLSWFSVGLIGGFLLLRYFSGVVSHPGISRCHNTLFL